VLLSPALKIYDSPIRVEVVKKTCEDNRMEPTSDGVCVCKGGTVDVRGKCVDSIVFSVTGAFAGFLLLAASICAYVRYKNYKTDEMWKIDVDELLFNDPVDVIGQGSFGVVLLAEYRGTKVAIKQATKAKASGSTKGRGSMAHRSSVVTTGGPAQNFRSTNVSQDVSAVSGESGSFDGRTAGSSDGQNDDIESGRVGNNNNNDPDSAGMTISRKGDGVDLGFLGAGAGREKESWAWFPWMRRDNYKRRFKESILGNASASGARSTMDAVFCPWFNKNAKAQAEFVKEMRVLSLLRHPCITTVMGAVITGTRNPMLVMEYMDYGSLHGLLRNETMYLSGEIIMQITRSVSFITRAVCCMFIRLL